MPTAMPTSTRTATIATRSHTHQGIAELEVTWCASYSKFIYTDLYLTYGNRKASKAKSARILPSIGFALVVITASSHIVQYKYNTGTLLVIISSPYSRSGLQGILVAHRCRIRTEASTTRSCCCLRCTDTLERHRNQPYIHSRRWYSQTLPFGARQSRAVLSSSCQDRSCSSSGSL